MSNNYSSAENLQEGRTATAHKKDYEFITINGLVEITPMRKVFKKCTMDRFNKDMKGRIHKQGCFQNALIAAKWFRERGIAVEVVEGFIVPKEATSAFIEGVAPENADPRIGSAHRFLKYGDKYFDPTLEFLFGVERLKLLVFAAFRSYEYETIMRFYMQMSLLYGEVYYSDTISGTGRVYVKGGYYEFPCDCIDEDGEYVMLDAKGAWESFVASMKA